MGDEHTAMARTIKQARAALVEAVARRMQAERTGPAGLRAVHTQVFEQLDRDGTRLTTLAERAQMSHQAMSELVSELAEHGYLERVPDPTDGRARLVRPTPLGIRELGRANRHLLDIHGQWQQRLDPLPVAQVLQALQTLIDVCAADD